MKICCKINEYTGSEWMDGEQADGRVDGDWEDEGIYGWTDGQRIDEWVRGWMGGWKT